MVFYDGREQGVHPLIGNGVACPINAATDCQLVIHAVCSAQRNHSLVFPVLRHGKTDTAAHTGADVVHGELTHHLGPFNAFDIGSPCQ